MPPLVSIVMPSLNQAAFIEQALQSIFQQDYVTLEVIVADGGSTDGTLDILNQWQTRDQRLKWISEQDKGPANAINKALKRSLGTYIGWLNADDCYLSGAISRAITALQNNPWLMVYGHGEHIDSQGNFLSRYPTLPASTPIDEFANGCFICQPTVFFKRTQLLLLGDLDESLKTAFDFDYWLRAFSRFPERIGFIDAVQAQSRLHDDCLTLKMRRTVALEGMQVIACHLGNAPGHWVMTYLEELLQSSAETWSFNNLRQHANALLRDIVDYIDPADLQKLKEIINQDKRLDYVKLIEPQKNAALALKEFDEGIVNVSSTPRMLTLETTSRCNLRCVMCPHAIDAVDRPKHLNDILINRMGNFIQQASAIQLHGIGEPMSSPAFWPLLDKIPPVEQCETSINTNLTLLDESRLQKLIHSNIKIVNVSIDAARPETYHRIRGYEFDKVIGNIEQLINQRNSIGKTYPLVYMNMTLMRSNIEETPEFIELAARLGANTVCFWHLNRWPESEMVRYIVTRDDWTFNYAQEGLWNYPQLSNEYLRRSEQTASLLNIRLYLDNNKSVYFNEAGINNA